MKRLENKVSIVYANDAAAGVIVKVFAGQGVNIFWPDVHEQSSIL
jgi:hypothetical protein